MRTRAKESVSIVMVKDTGSGIVLGSWSLSRQRERASLGKVRLSLIYLLLNVLIAHLEHGYWIPVLVLTFLYPCKIWKMRKG